MTHEVIAAWGTAGAATIALFLGLGPILYRLLTRPKLELELADGEPHCITVNAADGKVEALILRIQVNNKGRSPAESAWVRVAKYSNLPISKSESESGSGLSVEAAAKKPELYNKRTWEVVFEDFVNLAWDGFKDAKDVTIPAKSHLFTSLAEIPSRGEKFEFSFKQEPSTNQNQQQDVHNYHARHTDQTRQQPVEGHHHCVEVLYGANRSKPKTGVIFFTVDPHPKLRPLIKTIFDNNKPPKYDISKMPINRTPRDP